jgi:hypothetical protein
MFDKSKPKFSLYTPHKRRARSARRYSMILLFLYYDNWTDVTTTVVGTEQTML